MGQFPSKEHQFKKGNPGGPGRPRKHPVRPPRPRGRPRNEPGPWDLLERLDLEAIEPGLVDALLHRWLARVLAGDHRALVILLDTAYGKDWGGGVDLDEDADVPAPGDTAAAPGDDDPAELEAILAALGYRRQGAAPGPTA
jgi:hypothetical protein